MGSVERIDTGGFQEALDRISQARDAFRNSKEQIIAASDVMLGVWEGLGKNAFQDAYRIMKVELQDEEESLNVIYDDLKAIKESYEEWDTSVSEGLQQA